MKCVCLRTEADQRAGNVGRNRSRRKSVECYVRGGTISTHQGRQITQISQSAHHIEDTPPSHQYPQRKCKRKRPPTHSTIPRASANNDRTAHARTLERLSPQRWRRRFSRCLPDERKGSVAPHALPTSSQHVSSRSARSCIGAEDET